MVELLRAKHKLHSAQAKLQSLNEELQLSDLGLEKPTEMETPLPMQVNGEDKYCTANGHSARLAFN